MSANLSTRNENSLLPSSIEAEQAVIGAILVDADAFLKVIEQIDNADLFYKKAHKEIFKSFLDLSEKNENIDILTASQNLKDKGLLDDIGGLSYLSTLTEHAPIAANAPYYAKIIKQKAVLRNMIVAGNEIVELGHHSEEDLDELVDKAEQLIFSLAESRSKEQLLHISNLVHDSWTMLEEREANKGKLSGVNTGYHDLNALTSGLQKSELIVLAARPAMGKTSLALCIAENVAINSKKPVAIFSLEMSKEQLVQRLMCSRAEVDSSRVRSGQLHADDWARLGKAMSELGEAPIYIDDSAGVSVMELRGKCRRLQAQTGGELGLIVVDYLQLLEGKSSENRINQISEISRGLKLLAREINVPVLALSQLSRAVESRNDKRPMLSDLRESGCLTADTEIYLPDTGECKAIVELVGKENFNILALDQNNQLIKKEAKKAFYSGKKKIYKIKTWSGNEIKASANHPFLTYGGWKALEDLKENEFIATARKLKSDSGEFINDEELIIMAHMIGDGCYVPNQPYHYVSKDPNCLEMVSKISSSLYNIQCNAVADRNSEGTYSLYMPSPYHLTHNKKHPFTYTLEKYGLNKVRGYEKTLPKVLFTCPLDQVSLFLRHLWATDGSICHSIEPEESNKTGKFAITYSSQSFLLIKDLKKLLLRFNLHSRISVGKKAGYKDQYQLNISDIPGIKAFAERIGFFGKKLEDYKRILPLLESTESNPNADVIPKEAWSTVREILADKKLSHRRFQAELGTQYCGSTLFKSNISRKRMKKIASILGSEDLDNLAESDIFWDKIKSIELVGEEDVYDIEVPGLHNFVAENFIVHNSIEQDSDIVMFIYRDDYYNQDSEKAGIADVIIAKQRSGPTGTFELLFQNNITKFKNPIPTSIEA